jgi:hypothetical protein
MNAEENRLEDGLTPEERQSLGDLDGLEELLRAYAAPAWQPTQREALLAVLRPAVDARRAAGQEPQRVHGARAFFRVVLTQARSLERPFWVLYALLAAGLCLGSLLGYGGTLTSLMVAFGPIVVALFMVFALRGSAQGVWELEQSAPFGARKLLGARLALVLGSGLLLALPPLISLAVSDGLLTAARAALLAAAPVLLLCGLAEVLALRWKELAAAVLPSALWATFLFWALRQERITNLASWLLAQMQRSAPVAISVAMALLGGVLLLLLGNRWVERPRRTG